MNKILDNELLINESTIVNTNEYLSNTKIICLYFSASYCPPCVKFTPILANVYNELKKLNKDIEIINNGGWHFNNIFSPKDISIKLKTFAHTEFSDPEFSSVKVIKEKINKKK